MSSEEVGTTTIRLATIAEWPTHGCSKAAEARFDVLLAAAKDMGFGEFIGPDGRELWDKVSIERATLPALGEAVVRIGKLGSRKRVGVSGPFSDYAGYQWRWSPHHKAPAVRQVLDRIHRLEVES